ncbi:hypothetical protein ABPG74_002600, partial [Tetrahymena malaccensis]
MRINKIRALILIIFQVLKYAHFSVYRKCDENLFGMLSLDANSSQCIINQGEYSQQSEINNLSPYFVTPYCLGFQYSAGYSASFLTGINCLSNNQLIISYNAPRKIVKTYFEISLFFEYLDHSSSTLDIKTYVNINGIEYWTSSQYTNIQSDIFQNVAYYLQTSNMNQNTLKIEVTPFNLVFNKKQYQIFIKYILLAVQLDQSQNVGNQIYPTKTNVVFEKFIKNKSGEEILSLSNYQQYIQVIEEQYNPLQNQFLKILLIIE